MKVINIIPISQTGVHTDAHYFDGLPCFSPHRNAILFERAYLLHLKVESVLYTKVILIVALALLDIGIRYKTATKENLKFIWKQ
ncbi:hypothetical protein KORDIASMS9_01509 [Kordia sp. SMS9]|uniref:hypothetical protein n=1 Tax=Kordia sp. SMS9 TaxID=2282170 RepID=UPI000E0D742F|nr:hypothetical protein [Kordia sp. SMS9]AXG69289.1 hypothetical protein KORDIASMS9_01509 [Kordia sp. SMS9]